MRDEVWKIGKGVLMCFLSRSLDAACLGKTRLGMANRFPQSLQELFLKAPGQRVTVTVGAQDKEMEPVAIKNLLSYRLSQEGRKTPLPTDTA